MNDVYGIFKYYGIEARMEYEDVFASPQSAQDMCDDINRKFGLNCFIAPIHVCN